MYTDSTYIIRWQENILDTVRIVLMNGTTQVAIIADSIKSRTNAIVWKIASSLASDSSYIIKITSVNHAGRTDVSDHSFTLSKGVTNVSDSKNSVVVYSLFQNYPNPFNPKTIISYQLPVNSFITLKVYDAIGRDVATLVNETKTAGTYSVQFNGEHISSGMYFCRLQAGNFSVTRKMLLLR